MSKPKTKKVVGVPTIPLTARGYRTVDQMDSRYGRSGVGGGIPQDPLRDIEQEEVREAVQEFRDAKAKKKVLELKQKVEQMKQEIGGVSMTGGGLGIKGLYNFSKQDMLEISRMSDADQQAFYSTLRNIGAMAAMSPRGAGGQMNPILGLMAMGGFGGRGQQGLTLKDVLELQTNWATIYKGAGAGDQQLTNQLLMRLMTETVPNLQSQASQNMQMAYQAVIQNLQANQSDPLRDIRTVKELGSELGWRPGAQSDAVALKTLEMQNTWKQMEWKQRNEALQWQRQMGTIQQILDNVNIPQILGQGLRQETRRIMQTGRPQTVAQPVQAPPPQAAQPPTTAPMSQIKDYQCPNPNCGGIISAPINQPIVTCPGCGGSFRVTWEEQPRR